ncbi:SRPBCC family protein [Sphingobium sp. AN641]|uniref:SRPBCC family protein n=1 Tax=Sphingobium sp. AN641 TaxID=3133443 RepID=UPI0030BB2538
MMTHVARVNGYYTGVVHGNIDALWDVLMDWGDISWFHHGDNDGPALALSFLEGEPDAIPRTRVMTRDNAVDAGLPLENREVLILADKKSYRIYYDANDGMIGGIRNYLASWTLDPISDDSCQMSIQSMYDVDETGTVEEAKGWLDAVYVMIVEGLDRHMIKQRGAEAALSSPA